MNAEFLKWLRESVKKDDEFIARIHASRVWQLFIFTCGEFAAYVRIFLLSSVAGVLFYGFGMFRSGKLLESTAATLSTVPMAEIRLALFVILFFAIMFAGAAYGLRVGLRVGLRGKPNPGYGVLSPSPETNRAIGETQ